MAISFQTQDVDFKLKNTVRTKAWIKEIVTKEKKQTGDIHFVFMNDAALLQNNIKYLNHDTLTDIITFDYSVEKKVSGDIMISIERVEENAKKFKVDFQKEIQRVIIHGVLHLCGYKDKKRADQELMRKKEDAALRKF